MSDDQQPAWAQEAEVPFDQRPANSEKIWGAIAPDERSHTPRAKLADMFGRTPKGAVNTREAAERLGVSQRTVQRWIHDRKIPDSEAGQRLKESHQEWRNTPAGRSKALGRKIRSQAAGATRFTFTGHLKISSDVRHRKNMQVNVKDSALMQHVVDQVASGNDKAAHRALEELISESGDWGGDVAISIESLTFGDS